MLKYKTRTLYYCRCRAAFRNAIDSARQRGVEFLLTFEEWVKWWEDHAGPDWLKKRGKKRGQFVMARYEDKGSYCHENVKCITHADNVREANKSRIGIKYKKKVSKVSKKILRHKEAPTGCQSESSTSR